MRTSKRLIFIGFFLLSSMANADQGPTPITKKVWQEAVVSVTNLERTAAFFTELGGYQRVWQGPMHASEIAAWGLDQKASGEALLLGQPNRNEGYIRLVRFDNAGVKEPTRPGSRSWDTGCYFSLMVRMKDMQSVYQDAIKMGWWTETPITQYQFGDSHLNIMVFQGPDGVQVQAYERLSLPIPEAFPDFERFSAPFNVMQMVRSRDAAYDFFTKTLGFASFHKGEPYVSKEPVYMPLGIPKNLTTTARFLAGIVYPVPGEFGRVEMIEMMDLDGHDYAERCNAPNLGILAIRFPVESASDAAAKLERNWQLESKPMSVQIEPYGKLDLFNVKAPDGGNIHFYQAVD